MKTWGSGDDDTLPASIYVPGSDYLNRTVVEIQGTEVSFYVHYWGGTDVHFSNPIHKHSFFEVCYVIDGEGLYIEDSNVFSLQPGALFCSRPYIQHQIQSETGIGLVFVAFEVVSEKSTELGRQLFEQFANTSTFYLPEASDLSCMAIWKALLLECIHPEPLYHDRVNNLCGALLSSFENTFKDKSPPSRLPTPKTSGTLVYQAKLFIRDNLSMPLRLADVANQLHVSPRHLSRIFQIELGQTFSDYIRQQRVQSAAALLTTTNASIKEIAEETGFVTVYYFTKVFSSEMKLPPGQFRKKLANE